MKKWKTVDSKLLCRTGFVAVYEDSVILPSGKQISYTTIELRDYVSVLPLVGEKIAMIEVLRYPRNQVSLEIPSGHIENGETPKGAAKRELSEETGYTAEKLDFMGTFHPLSRSKQQAHLFLATALKKGTQKLEETEQIEVKLVPIKDITRLLNNGKITHNPTIIALQKFLLTKNKHES